MEPVAYTDEFGEWFESLEERDQDAVARGVKLLDAFGIALPFPHSSAIKNSAFPLRELRCQAGGTPLRVIYAFNPVRQSILILGGDKTGDERFYKRLVPQAEKIWKRYLDEKAWETDE